MELKFILYSNLTRILRKKMLIDDLKFQRKYFISAFTLRDHLDLKRCQISPHLNNRKLHIELRNMKNFHAIYLLNYVDDMNPLDTILPVCLVELRQKEKKCLPSRKNLMDFYCYVILGNIV